jgi:CheY-like chemotaxis protein
MDLRVLVLTADAGLAELLRTQVENLGCPCTTVDSYDAAGPSLSWADAVVIDLVDDGLDTLHRLRVEAPMLHVVAVAPDAELAEQATAAGAVRVLQEPLTITDVVEAVRSLAPGTGAEVIDLRTGERSTVPEVDDAPWWATR